MSFGVSDPPVRAGNSSRSQVGRAGTIDLFVDGGANIGIWSVVASGVARDVVAVEASTSILPFLRRNSRHSPIPFDVLEKALWSESGHAISFCCSEDRHASASIAEVAKHDTKQPGWRTECVETISLDDIIGRRGHRDGSGVLLFKLDLEGAELAVMRGASWAMAADRSLVVYEDHGQDVTHAVSAHLLSRGDLRIYHLGRAGLSEIRTLDNLTAIKTSRKVGYNFFCCRPDGVAERLLRCAGDSPVDEGPA